MLDGEYAGEGPSLLVPVTPGAHEITATVNGNIQVRRIVYPRIKRVSFR